MNNKKISVLIVVYNAQEYIKKTIQSCLNQTYNNFEILILDNNSSDDTCKIVEIFKDEKIKLFKSQKNIGPYAGLNYLLEKAQGDYIAIQDHDDVWFPKKIEKQVKFLKDNKNFIACGVNTFYYYENRDVLILTKKSKVTDFVDHTSLVFRNENFRYDELNSLSDLHFEKKVLSRSGKIACLQQPLGVHRIRSDVNNFSLNRFKFNYKNLRDYFSLNKNIFDLFNFLFVKYIPEKLIWKIRQLLTLRNSTWIEKDDFVNKYKIII